MPDAPGLLLSAYGLLTHKPKVTQEELAVELSGVLCRCTGYRNILSAVADVARTHPDGIAPPLNCAPRPPDPGRRDEPESQRVAAEPKMVALTSGATGPPSSSETSAPGT